MGNYSRKIKNISIFIGFYKYYRRDRKIKDYFDRQALIFELGVEKDEFVFLSSTGIGDLYLKLLLINGLKETLGTQKISIGYLKQKHIGVINLFRKDIYKIYKLNEDEINQLSEYSSKPSLGTVSHPYNTINKFQSIGFHNFNFLDLIKLQFNIPLEFNNYCKPSLTNEINLIVRSKMDELGVELNQAVLIAPTAVTFKPISTDFWIDMIDILIRRGRKVLLLEKSLNFKNYSNANLIYIDFPLEEAISITNYCGSFIGYRSGICDLVESSTAKKVIIYPENDNNYFDHFKGFSFIEMGFLHEDKFKEIVFDEKNKEDVIKYTLEYLDI